MAMAMAMASRRYCVLYFNLSAETPEAVQQRSAKHMAFSELVSPEPMSSTPRNSSCNCVHQFSTGRQLSTPDLYALKAPFPYRICSNAALTGAVSNASTLHSVQNIECFAQQVPECINCEDSRYPLSKHT